VEIIAGESGIQPPFFSGEDRCMALQSVRQHILLVLALSCSLPDFDPVECQPLEE
jgi:hypothetical protein